MIGAAVDAFGKWLVGQWMRRERALPPTSALVLLDVQRELLHSDFLPDEARPPGFEDRIQLLGQRCRNAGIRVLHAPVEVPPEPIRAVENTRYLRTLREAGKLRPGSSGAEIPGALLHRDDVVLSPRTSLDAFAGTNLAARLDAEGVTHLVLAGSVVEASVDSTARGAVERGYYVRVVSDCVGGLDAEARRLALAVTLPRVAHDVGPLDALGL